MLAGGVGEDGSVHSTVERRLQAAAALYKLRRMPIIANGGGTAHKPKFVDAAGFPVPEAQIMASRLVELGVAVEDVYPEGFSDDTIGNAFLCRTMHTEWSGWRSLLLITSEFQMARASATYKWLFALPPLVGSVPYDIVPTAVPDSGTLPEDVLAARCEREAASLASFSRGVGATVLSLEALHKWLFTQHKAYAVRLEPREALDPTILKTY